MLKEDIVKTQLISIPKKRKYKVQTKDLDKEVTFFIAKLRSSRTPIRWIIDTLLVSQRYYAAEEVLRRYGQEELTVSDEFFYQAVIYYRTNRLSEVIDLLLPLLKATNETAE